MSGWLKGLLALAGVTVIVVGSLIGVLLGKEIWRNVNAGVTASGVVNVDPEDASIVDRLHMSEFLRVGDGPMSSATLFVSQNFSISGGLMDYSKDTRANAVNMLFLEPGQPERWLFESNDQLIYRSSPVSLLPIGSDPKDQPQAAILLLLITSDTNGDNRLSETDRRSVALVRPDGRGLVTLVDPLDGNVTTLPDPSAIVVSIERAAGLEILRIDAADFEILDRKTVDFPN